MSAKPRFQDVWAGPIELAPLDLSGGLTAAQTLWRTLLTEELYGPIPAHPFAVEVALSPLPDAHAEQVTVTIEARGSRFTVDCALWLPPGASAGTPIIVGLDFVGPAGVLTSDTFPLDPAARVFSRPDLGFDDGRLTDVLRGATQYRWPIEMILANGYGVMVSCYGSWVPDDPLLWVAHGVQPLLGDPEAGAISLWAWSLSRMIDALDGLQLGGAGVIAAGHSRLGKAALWAAAHDRRIDAVFANQSGCGGAAPSSHIVGEDLSQLANRFPHWLRPDPVLKNADRQVDQHHLLGAIAPARLYIASAEQDIWADPLGSYAALRAARIAWGEIDTWPDPETVWNNLTDLVSPFAGHHIRTGGHDMLPYDWKRFLRFLEQGFDTFGSN